MPPMQDRKTEALVVDDEPEYLQFIVDYLQTKGLGVRFARTLPEALQMVQEAKYRIVLVDMNIPALSAVTPEMRQRTPLVDRYPGIAVAARCRNLGYGAHAVIAYTVHDDDAADAELSKLNCRYVLKGRPEVLKRVLENSLAGTGVRAAKPGHTRTNTQSPGRRRPPKR